MAKEKAAPGKPKKGKLADKDVIRTRVVRDSYTMPEIDYQRLKDLKKVLLEQGVHVKKSELLRAGLLALEGMKSAERLVLLQKIERIKTGRPSKGE